MNTVINARDGSVRIELYLDGSQAAHRFEALLEKKREIEKSIGEALEWDKKVGRRVHKVAAVNSCDPTDREDWPNQHQWIIDRRTAFERVFRPLVKEFSTA